MKLSSLLIPLASAFMALDPEITTLEPQLEMETQAPTGIPATDEFHFIDEQAFFSSESTTSETTAATTTLYNNDGIVGLKFAGGGKGGKKSKKSKKTQKKNPQKENAVENIMKIHGDEAAPRKDHKCGNIPLPEIKCDDCEQGYPRYRRPCGGPEETKGVFKCRIECGPGFKVSAGSPKKMKCLGKPNEPKFWKPKKYEKDRFALSPVNEGIDENNNSQQASQHSSQRDTIDDFDRSFGSEYFGSQKKEQTEEETPGVSPLAAASQEKQLSQEEVEEVVRARPCCMQFETIIVKQENFGPWEEGKGPCTFHEFYYKRWHAMIAETARERELRRGESPYQRSKRKKREREEREAVAKKKHAPFHVYDPEVYKDKTYVLPRRNQAERNFLPVNDGSFFFW
ncbi:Oidioi.mRNA.OKI2018_I69.XSR.g15015.t1.cds [Oikopleura dioica]|uniref:Oidioi.mRNA.OKI2018_I69.XSR.g15015.t1.cds n=1 Tax=Oikopleura dioica TaxID=34765 RepID=A0ABN7SGJ9_OIKDI|nr:Oidioi.mRNA.OKI2018_I69.XSR.g15015.t1.cds [Oikopleura dioica]